MVQFVFRAGFQAPPDLKIRVLAKLRVPLEVRCVVVLWIPATNCAHQ